MKKRRLTHGLRATFLLLPFLFPDIVLAQSSSPGVTTLNSRDGDFKHYSTIPATSPGTGVVMVGTRFTNAASGNPNYTHFARVDNGRFPGTPIWKYLQEISANCVDERSVHAVANPNIANEYFLTSLVRFDNSGFFEDGIKIYAVDDLGDLIITKPPVVIKSDNENLYPMHSLYHNGYLYICGYAMALNSLSLPDQGPTYIPNSYGSSPRWEKEAFVMRVDPTNLTVTHFQKMNYTFQYQGPGGGIYPHPAAGTVNQPTGGSDFDMAVRMTVLPSGNIHVTGSVNAMSFTLGASPSNDWDNSAVMNIVMDPANLNILHDKPFRMENGGGWNEAMGIGIVPAVTTGGGVIPGFFLVGNHYTPEIWLPNYGDLGGYSPVPHYPFAVYLADNGSGFPEPIYNTNLEAYFPYTGLQPNASQTMMSLGIPTSQGGYWAVNLVDCPGGLYCNLNAPNNDPQQVVWIAGYRGGYGSNNYEVTLSKINLAYDLGNSRPGVGLSDGTYYETQLSNYHSSVGPDPTGPIFVTPTLVPNNFFALGLGLSNMMWSPTFAARMPVTDDIVVAAPKWYPGFGGGANGQLNVKLIRAGIDKGTTQENGTFFPLEYCMGSHNPFTYDTVGQRVIEPHGVDMDLVKNYNTGSVIYLQTNSQVITRQIPTPLTCEFTGDHKPAGVDEIISSTKTLVYPNPAGSQVFVVPASSIAGNQAVDVVLLNLLGQAVGNLYSGEAAGLGAKNALQLPELANGLYMIQLQSNGQLLHNERLTIQR